jgi:hypothetical protein
MSSFAKQLSPFQRGAVQAACVDMWEPFKQSITRVAAQLPHHL